MEIPESFFESEVRDGFYVPAKMKRAWATILTVLNEIAIVCERHNIRWWVDWGSLISAVRHNGFIPWDDDMDISMLRPDFERFKEVAPRELPEGYFLYTIYSDPYFGGYMTSRVNNRRNILIDNDFLRDNHGYPYHAGVDITCIDYVDPDEERGRETRKIIWYIYQLTDYIKPLTRYKELKDYRKTVDEVGSLCGITFKEDDLVINKLYIAADKLMSTIDERDAREVAHMVFYSVRDVFNSVYPKEYLTDFIKIPYEFTEIYVPLHYDYILKKSFGDYMKPTRKGGTHNYPCYADQENRIFQETGKILWGTYPFSSEDLKEKKIEGNENNDILFFVTHPGNWIFMDRFYREAVSDPKKHVYVIPIPYYKRTYNFQVSREVYYETEGFPNGISLTGFDQYDYLMNKPDVVYFDTPYDLFDAGIAVHPLFYAETIRQYAKKMIYVSCILVDEFEKEDFKAKEMMKFCINTPGVAKADEVIVQSETIRERYITSLTEWAGEESRRKWEEKIKTGGLTSEEFDLYPPVKDEELSEEWMEVLYYRD